MYAYNTSMRSKQAPPRRAVESRSRSPRRTTPLRRDEIIAAAITATTRGRLREMTMRGLAEGLHVTPMALYAHVADKDEILDEILDHLLDEIELPSARLQWRAWMLEFASQINALLCHYPDLLTRYLRRPVGVRSAVVRMEAALGVLSHAGFAAEACLDIYASVHVCTLGFSALEVARSEAMSGTQSTTASVSVRPDAAGFWPAFFSTLPSEQFPQLSSLRPDLATFTSPERFRRLIRDLLAGRQPPPAAPAKSRKKSTS